MRLFFAFGVPTAENERLQPVVEALAADLPSARWVDPANRHVTVRFLGQVNEDALDPVSAAARQAASRTRPGEVSMGGIGAFPKMGRARVLWAGIDDHEGVAAALSQGLEDGLVAAGFVREERPYTPHLTLARFKTPASVSPHVRDLLSGGRPFSLDTLHLMESRLSPKGARYEVRESFTLGCVP